VCAELAGETVPLREILRARNQRRRELRGVMRDRQADVDTLLRVKRGEVTEKEDAPPKPRRPTHSKAIRTPAQEGDRFANVGRQCRRNVAQALGSECQQPAPAALWPLGSTADPVAPATPAFVAGSRFAPSARQAG